MFTTLVHVLARSNLNLKTFVLSCFSTRYKTQPPELTAEEKADPFQDAEQAPRRKFKYEGRHMTQPITPDEMREAEATTPASNLTRTPGGSIADRCGASDAL